MAQTKYDDLYCYLSAFQDKKIDAIAAYLSTLNENQFHSFLDDLALLIPVERFEKSSVFNFSVDSTLEGGAFPCPDFRCREANLYNTARFAALHADKILIRSPLDQLFSNPHGHDEFVDLEELAFAIYATLQLEHIVKAGYMGFTYDGIPICNECLEYQLSREAKEKQRLAGLWDELVDDLCSSAQFILERGNDGQAYVTVTGMERFGVHEEIDVTFNRTPDRYTDILARASSVKLKKQDIIIGGLDTLLLPIVNDTFHAAVSPRTIGGSYLTTRPVQIDLLKSTATTLDHARTDQSSRMILNYRLPFAENASLKSIIDFRKVHEELFATFRDTLNANLSNSNFDEKTLLDLKQNVITPELNKINLAIKANRHRLVTIAGADAIIGIASIACAQIGLSAQGVIELASLLGAGTFGSELAHHLRKDHLQDNPMYFLWDLERRTNR